MTEHLTRYIRFFESLSPDSLGEIDQIFSRDAAFRDPFNDVRGHAAIRRIFTHMFDSCTEPQFVVDEAVESHGIAYLRWEFSFGKNPRTRIIGVSRVQFSAHGKVLEHVDYWDPATGLYERIPLLGGVLRMIRRRLTARGGSHRVDG